MDRCSIIDLDITPEEQNRWTKIETLIGIVRKTHSHDQCLSVLLFFKLIINGSGQFAIGLD